MKRWWGASMLGLLVALGDAGAQSVSLGASAGVAVPQGALAGRRTAAPYIAASALFGSQFRRIALKAETRAHIILSDYANSDFETSAFWPLMIGVRF